MRFRSYIRWISFGLFIALLTLAIFKTPIIAASDIFLRLDPGLVLISVIGGRTLAPEYLTAVCVLALTLTCGRIFCGYICPMGIFIDIIDRFTQPSAINKETDRKLKAIKYYFLAFMLGAAIFGISLIFLGSPLSLITRFFGLVVYPVLAAIVNQLLIAARPLADMFDVHTLTFLQLLTPRFAAQGFILCFVALLIISARYSLRFWCRYLCPSGALMGLCAKKPYIRRITDDTCINCGKCVRACPMSAIPESAPETTNYQECIVCRSCEQVCPVKAVTFSPKTALRTAEPLHWERRRFLRYSLAGTGTALVALTGLHAPYSAAGEGRVTAEILRPPGSLLEQDFLARCVRCGQCMAVCPTNTLQPIWFETGWFGVFSPALNLVRGPCNPKCHRCSQVCPTGAIRSLSPEERIWARPGTALIFQHRCLAWEQQKPCMVCDEVCPYNAISFKQQPGIKVPVPYLDADKCGGCGYCQYFCPVKPSSAISLYPAGELRLNFGSYQEEARNKGLTLVIAPKTTEIHNYIYHDMPDIAPGFDAEP